jgi:hypothetical protein
MKELASRTGGKAYYDRNDIQNSIREAVTDAAVTYALAYYPSERKDDGEFHAIKVKTRRSGTTVRHRKGYYDWREQDFSDPQLRNAALADAAWSPVDATSVRLDVRVTPSTGGKLVLEAIIDPASITLEPRDGKWCGKLDLLQIETDDRGGALNPASRTITIEATEETYRNASKSGFILRWEVVRRPEANNLKIVVRDVPTGNVGSLAIPYSKITAANLQ